MIVEGNVRQTGFTDQENKCEKFGSRPNFLSRVQAFFHNYMMITHEKSCSLTFDAEMYFLNLTHREREREREIVRQ